MHQFADLEKKFEKLIHIVHLAGGRFVFVGGCVRDILLGLTPKDIDAEVYGLSYEKLSQALSVLGTVSEVGKQFGVLKLSGFDIDIALPRFDQKVGAGHRGFSVKVDYSMSFAESAKRRDLTINAIGYAPDQKAILDPYDGVKDLHAGRLQAVSADTFGEDPLRALRVAQFAARFGMKPTESLIDICTDIPLSELPKERIAGELRKMLFIGQIPSLGFRFLEETGLLSFALPVMDRLSPVDYKALLKVLDSVYLHNHHASKKYPLYTMCIFASFFAIQHRSTAIDYFLISEKQKKKALCLLKEIDIYISKPCIQRAQLFWSGHRLLQQDLSWHDLMAILNILLAKTTYVSLLKEQVFETGAMHAQHLEPVVTGATLIQKGLLPSEEFQTILDRCLRIQFEQNIRDPNKILKQIL